MSINQTRLLSYLRDVYVSDDIGSKRFESRFEDGAFENLDLIGFSPEETKPELRERDSYLLYLRRQGYVGFDVQMYDGREEFFGGLVSITPEGVRFLEEHSRTFWQRQIAALSDNILTIAISVVSSLAIAWALYFLGPT